MTSINSRRLNATLYKVHSAFLCYAKTKLSFKKAQAKSQYIINSLFLEKLVVSVHRSRLRLVYIVLKY